MTSEPSGGARDAAPDHGATAVEYAIMISLIAAVIFATVLVLGQQVLGFFTTAEGLFP